MIYIDVDGVIADFKTWMSQFGNFTEEEWAKTDKPWKIMEKHIDVLYSNLNPLDLLFHFNNLYQYGNCKFLSAAPYQWYETDYWNKAVENKLSWMRKHIDNFKDEDLIVTRGANKKIEFCKTNFVLYDDRKDTVEKWIAAGGIGIHVIGRPNKMKYAITGHTKGLGKALFSQWNGSAIGFSRSNGFDISDPASRQKIVDMSVDADVFINNAYCIHYQTDLLYELYKSWKDKEKLIINIGSNTTDGIKNKEWSYSAHKASLEKASEQLSYLNNKCKVSLIKFGYVGTERVLETIKPAKYIDITDAVKLINLIIDLNITNSCTNITFIP